jgi:hypothetical protein
MSGYNGDAPATRSLLEELILELPTTGNTTSSIMSSPRFSETKSPQITGRRALGPVGAGLPS